MGKTWIRLALVELKKEKGETGEILLALKSKRFLILRKEKQDRKNQAIRIQWVDFPNLPLRAKMVFHAKEFS